ncbi:hypothetical protein ANRL2_01084 [Anaerolineae bacterium]|uniref:hypothetical protein n=1 Tax=Dokdonella sp. TaxID=2291710 RepID=UPI001ACF4659|nr:hypothetical protein [Dokdonella sp.]MBZ0223224.1 hypothetical protein [Dokdonella sp.]MCC7255826.1 hypothetical protein [Dokdonella sp.]CAG0963606.1 hypothetical protein ANRL2_01084 [Anaerolineae bacterium]
MPNLDASLPEFWSLTVDDPNRQRLRFAIRSGAARWTLLALGVALMLGGLWFAYWLTRGEGELTVAGWILLGLVTGGALLAGVYCCGRVLWARSDYLLDDTHLCVREVSVFGSRRREIKRADLTLIEQIYTPPGESDPKGAEGHWLTILSWNALGSGQRHMALDGMKTERECQWLSGLLAHWAQAPVKRAFSGGLEEADPAELPAESNAKRR